ncbi:MAG: hypothetical protein JWM58_4531 [Rhizobium sp.]|nr:hypothetical protein [Rhizobium sp.]
MGKHFGNVSVTIFHDDVPSAAQAPIFNLKTDKARDVARFVTGGRLRRQWDE